MGESIYVSVEGLMAGDFDDTDGKMNLFVS
jgi:hypothetical protein